jgi:hypothetical protein
VLGGVLLVTGSGLVGMTLLGSADDRVAVLALRRPVEPGQVLADTDLAVVGLAAEGDLRYLPADRRAEVVGQVAVAPLPAGALLHPSNVAARPAVGPGRAVVALALGPGDLPYPSLRAGDDVVLVETEPPELDRALADAGALPPAGAWAAEVFVVHPITHDGLASGGVVVSLSVDVGDAPAVAAAVAGERFRLVFVPSGAEAAALARGLLPPDAG